MSCIQELEGYGYLEKYTNTSIKKSAAKLKKSAEVHKHHTYYQITRSGVAALNNLNPAAYLPYLADECVSSLMSGGEQPIIEEKANRLIRMGLLGRHMEVTSLGKQVLKELKK